MVHLKIKDFFKRGVNVQGVARTKEVFGRASSAIKPYMLGGAKNPTAQRFIREAGTAILPAGRVGGIVQRGASAVGRGIRGLAGASIARVPFEAGKAGLRAWGLGRLGTATGITTLPIGFAIASGANLSPKDVLRTAGSALISPVGAVFGTLFREGGQFTQKVKEFAGERLPRPDFVPDFPDIGGATTIFNFPEFQIPQTPNIPAVSGGFTTGGLPFGAPSINVGGGGIPPELLLLIAGGAGALGYGLGRRRRRKRKRKRYKRGKRK